MKWSLCDFIYLIVGILTLPIRMIIMEIWLLLLIVEDSCKNLVMDIKECKQRWKNENNN